MLLDCHNGLALCLGLGQRVFHGPQLVILAEVMLVVPLSSQSGAAGPGLVASPTRQNLQLHSDLPCLLPLPRRLLAPPRAPAVRSLLPLSPARAHGAISRN